MFDNHQDIPYEQFVVHLRSALHYLYDPVQLRRSPLVDLLGLRGEFDRAAALQQMLVAAVRSLKPADDEPPQARSWRIYDTLSLQYVRQLDREAVANQLGISDRQLRREQRVAIEALAQHLWQSPQLHAASPAHSVPAPGNVQNAGPAVPAGASEQGSAGKGPAPELRIPLGEALENVRSLALPLAHQMNVTLHIYITAGLVGLPVSPMPLRTILLTVLTIAIPLAGKGAVAMAATRRDDEIAVAVTCDDPAAAQAPLPDKELARLVTAQEQAAFYAARLEIGDPGRRGLRVTLLLPAPEQTLVLVVDDNPDWLELVQRYALDTRYQIAATRSPEAACDTAGKLQPALIILDVMMHNVDGWQVLSELRHDPATSHIPVVVCTVLPLEEMALALGANAFLQKPVSQQQFLQVLESLEIM